MSAPSFKCELVGGPSDGLVVVDPPYVTRDKVQLPIGPAMVPRGHTRCYELVGQWTATYRLTAEHHAIAPGELARRQRYDFAGYELVSAHAHQAPLRLAAPRWLAGLASWIRQVPSNFVKWLTEPIDYPLNVRGIQVPADEHPKSQSCDGGPLPRPCDEPRTEQRSSERVKP
jgi:hypothetical protein